MIVKILIRIIFVKFKFFHLKYSNYSVSETTEICEKNESIDKDFQLHSSTVLLKKIELENSNRGIL